MYVGLLHRERARNRKMTCSREHSIIKLHRRSDMFVGPVGKGSFLSDSPGRIEIANDKALAGSEILGSE